MVSDGDIAAISLVSASAVGGMLKKFAGLLAGPELKERAGGEDVYVPNSQVGITQAWAQTSVYHAASAARAAQYATNSAAETEKMIEQAMGEIAKITHKRTNPVNSGNPDFNELCPEYKAETPDHPGVASGILKGLA
eukprot:GEMP01066504.1.p1 GENE.GEMP01066504.1~~GEMP01066504.1.p1  ORF type:complete len:137 (+),score=27.30 GEMP01066504.1:233-643(+)